MNSDIRQLLEAVRSGETSVDDALLEIKKAPFEDIGYDITEKDGINELSKGESASHIHKITF